MRQTIANAGLRAAPADSGEAAALRVTVAELRGEVARLAEAVSADAAERRRANTVALIAA